MSGIGRAIRFAAAGAILTGGGATAYEIFDHEPAQAELDTNVEETGAAVDAAVADLIATVGPDGTLTLTHEQREDLRAASEAYNAAKSAEPETKAADKALKVGIFAEFGAISGFILGAVLQHIHLLRRGDLD